jgi:hypothetical protein
MRKNSRKSEKSGCPLKVLLAFLMLFLAVPSFGAEESGEELYNRSLYYWQQAQDSVQKIGSQCMNCTAFTAGKSEKPSPQCRATWDAFYAKKTIDLRVMMGYNDFGKAVYDFRTAQAMIDLITDVCIPGANLCGFRRDPDDHRYFTKPITINGKRKLIRLMIAWSSIGDNDDENTGRKLAKDTGLSKKDMKGGQQRRTKEMEDLFQDSLVNADATFYLGHARYGAGPDFGPPRRLADGNRDNEWYKDPKNQESRRRMLKTLSEAKAKNRLFGLFGCDAEPLFGEELRKAAPELATITPTGLAYPESSTAQLYGALDSILGRRCAEDFSKAANSLATIDVQGPKKVISLPVPPVKLQGFFP